MILLGEKRDPHVPIVTVRDDHTKADEYVALKIGWQLKRLYPGHAWLIEATARHGVALIKHGLLSHKFPKYRNFGYVIRLADLRSDSMIEAEAMRAGGELLEYFNVARGRYTGDLAGAKPAYDRMPQGRIAA